MNNNSFKYQKIRVEYLLLIFQIKQSNFNHFNYLNDLIKSNELKQSKNLKQLNQNLINKFDDVNKNLNEQKNLIQSLKLQNKNYKKKIENYNYNLFEKYSFNFLLKDY